MSDNTLTFKQYFFRIYDKKILSGEITFSQIGISKSVFNQLCNDLNFQASKELIDRLRTGMKLTDEEYKKMISYLDEGETK